MFYRANNYSMGRVVSTTTFEANTHEEAVKVAERKLPGKHGLGQGGSKARILGIRVIGALLIALTLALTANSLSPTAEARGPRAVALWDALEAPKFMEFLPPRSYMTRTQQCGRGGFWSDLSAYRWNGSALPAQRWNADHTILRWGRVTFDGITWINRYNRPVIVAAWCA